MQKINQIFIKSVVKKALDEDLNPRGDITTNLISFKKKSTKLINLGSGSEYSRDHWVKKMKENYLKDENRFLVPHSVFPMKNL